MSFPSRATRHTKLGLIPLLVMSFLCYCCHSSAPVESRGNFMDDTQVSLRIAPPSRGNLHYTMGVSIVDSPGNFHVLVHRNKMVLCEVYISVSSNTTGTLRESFCEIAPKELEEGDNSVHLLIYSTDTAQLVLTTTTHIFVPWGVVDSVSNDQQ